MNKKIRLGTAIACMALTAAFIAVLVVSVYHIQINKKLTDFNEKQQRFSKLLVLDETVRTNCLDELDNVALEDSILSGYLQGIGDSYSYYLSKSEYSLLQNSFDGVYETLGLHVTREPATGLLMVCRVSAGSSAESSGLLVGDLIYAINGETVPDMDYAHAISALNGVPGTELRIGIVRGASFNTFKELSLTHSEYTFTTVSGRLLKDSTIGLIRIEDFNSATETAFTETLAALETQGITALILDVRNNPGTDMDAVLAVLRHLVGPGELFSSRDAAGKITVYDGTLSPKNYATVVLINRYTSFGAEIFAATLSARGGAVLLGETTAGKATEQTFLPFTDGSAIYMSVREYYVTEDSSFRDVGITPTVEVEMTEQQFKNFHRLDENTDPQLIAAIKTFSSKK